MYFLAQFRFRLALLWRFQPILLASMATWFVLACAALGWLYTSQLAYERVNRELSSTSALAQPTKSPSSHTLPLPRFDSVTLVAAMEDVATATKTDLDEVSFVLEDAQARPYRRYRASFILIGRYPNIRAFVEQVRKRIPYSSLDSIKCSRDEIDAVDVSCALAISAFYAASERAK